MIKLTQPCFLLGPFTEEEVPHLEAALRDTFPGCILERSVMIDGLCLIMGQAKCSEAGLTGFIRGVLWSLKRET